MFRGRPEHVKSLPVTPWLVNNLGVSLPLGRWFRDPAHEPEGYNIAVPSNGLWHRLGADPNIVGKSITLSGRRLTVSGVAPPLFHLPLADVLWQGAENDLWVPLDPRGHEQNRSQSIYLAYARLRPGVSLASATADVKRVAAQIAKDDPVNHPSYSARLESVRESAVEDVRPALLVLSGAVALLFLLTCANVAALLVARSVARARETAVRVALGASRNQLAQQYFLEGLFLASPGAVLGIFLSIALVRLVVSIAGQLRA